MLEKLWPAVLDSIEKRVSPKNFASWFSPLKFLETDNNTVYLGVPDRFTRDWIMDHGFWDILQEEYCSQASDDVRVVLRIAEGAERPVTDVSYSPKPVDVKEEFSDTGSEIANYARTVREVGLNPRYVFDQFVVGPSNQLAYAASINVAENPASAYNPLFIYGGAGLGKTHLINAIGHHILKERNNFKILYTSTETFVNEMINSIRTHRMDEFRNKFRSNCDLLLIDDIQFISGKVRTQEEFFHTFNTLYESHRQIIITSDAYPQEIPELEDRLRTRFQWGLIADIQPPEMETRVAILQKKAESDGLDIPDDVAMFVASSVKSNIREIEGSLKRLGAFSSMYGKPITLEFAQDVLKDVFGGATPLSIDDIQKAVASFFAIKLADLKSNRRHRSISRPRQIAMYLCRTYLNSTYPEIGASFKKDHSTAITAVRNIEKLLLNDAAIREAVEGLRRQLGI